MPADAVDPASIRRVLLIRPRFLGDVCLTLPALDAVRGACPRARVGYLVEEPFAPLLRGDPRVDALIVSGHGGSRRVFQDIRRFQPQVVLDLFCNPRTALWTLLSGAAIRVGYPGKGWRSLAYTHHVRPRTLSATGFHLASVARLGWPAPDVAPRLVGDEREREEARRSLRELGLASPGPRLGLHPGARWPTRRWAPERFVALAQHYLERRTSGVVLVSGAADEADLVEGVVRALPRGRAAAVVGWPIGRFVAFQSLCEAFVCGDTGPLHTAASMGTPTLGLMSRNRPAMFFPYDRAAGHRAYYARVECSPCHRDVCADLRCLDRLTVEGAWSLLSGMLAETPSREA